MNKDERDALIKERSRLLSINFHAEKEVEPRLFQLMLENISNVRNTLVVCGALASFGIAAIANSALALGFISRLLFDFAEISLLCATLFYFFYLKKHIGAGFDAYKTLKKNATSAGKRKLELINARLAEKIEHGDFLQKLKNLENELEEVLLNPTKDNEVSKDPQEKWWGDAGNISLTLGIILLILGVLSMAFSKPSDNVSAKKHDFKANQSVFCCARRDTCWPC